MDTSSPSTETFDPRSGMGQASVIPDEIKRWSWGAFLLTFIWGIVNKVWLALLVFVPFVNVIAPFILGAKGNELAWRARKWKSVEEFQQTQKKWAIAGAIVCGVWVLLMIAAVAIPLIFGKPVPMDSQDRMMDDMQMATDTSDDEYSYTGGDEANSVGTDADGYTYYSTEGDFTIQFTDLPDIKNGSYDEADGTTVETKLLQSSDESGSVYFVAIETHPNAVLPSNASDDVIIAKLNDILKDAEKNIEGGTIVSTSKETFAGKTALKYEMTVGPDRRVEHGYILIVDKRAYTVATESDQGVTPEYGESFFSSFDLK